MYDSNAHLFVCFYFFFCSCLPRWELIRRLCVCVCVLTAQGTTACSPRRSASAWSSSFRTRSLERTRTSKRRWKQFASRTASDLIAKQESRRSASKSFFISCRSHFTLSLSLYVILHVSTSIYYRRDLIKYEPYGLLNFRNIVRCRSCQLRSTTHHLEAALGALHDSRVVGIGHRASNVFERHPGRVAAAGTSNVVGSHGSPLDGASL